MRRQRVPLVFDQIELKPLVLLLPGGKKNAADRLDRSALTADDAAHVAIGDTYLDTDVLAVRTLGHLNGVGFADQRFDDLFYSSFHFRSLPPQITERIQRIFLYTLRG